MPLGVTRNSQTAHTAKLSIQQEGHSVSIGEALGVYVVFSRTCDESTFNGLGLSIQLAST